MKKERIMGQRYTRPLTYAGIDTDQIRGIKFYGVLKGKNNLIIYEKHLELKNKGAIDKVPKNLAPIIL